MNIKEDDIELLLFYSFRYALGRKTYTVHDVASLIIKYERILDGHSRVTIRKEIQVAIDKGRAGMDVDVQEWKKVLEVL